MHFTWKFSPELKYYFECFFKGKFNESKEVTRYALSLLITRYLLSKVKCIIISFITRLFPAL